RCRQEDEDDEDDVDDLFITIRGYIESTARSYKKFLHENEDLLIAKYETAQQTIADEVIINK
ncbi:28695_t:CDS:2, partial [Gigaspora margarita]